MYRRHAAKFGQQSLWSARYDERYRQYPGGTHSPYSPNSGTGGGGLLPESETTIDPYELGGTITDSVVEIQDGKEVEVFGGMLNAYAESLGPVAFEKTVETLPDNVIAFPQPVKEIPQAGIRPVAAH